MACVSCASAHLYLLLDISSRCLGLWFLVPLADPRKRNRPSHAHAGYLLALYDKADVSSHP